MEIAQVVKERSTCLSRKVGCVIVKDNQILSTGYNGSIRGHAHCDKSTCKKGCDNTIHAEINAVISAAYNGVQIKNCDIYTTTSPCINCLRVLLNLDINNIYFFEKYQTKHQDEIDDLLKLHPKKIGYYKI